MIIKIVLFLLGLISSLFFSACQTIDSYRIPASAVNIKLDNIGLWNTYGVNGYGNYRRFIRSEKQPANFSYTELTYTGFGGVLLISGRDAASGSYNYPLAYDLACPVEAKYNVRVSINANYEAECPKCGSKFNVCEGDGTPISGQALDNHFGLQRYHVIAAELGGYTIVR
ncbi:MAG: hypothetical protein PHR45_00965 [Muribaculaceae bacterium]|nr:hypothetical protein [Muribaculaceae bacterium]